jgi:hypothetical protein
VVNRPSQPEIITVNSEELQQLVRDLLPSQNGFGSELQASNVITPIIDLTATAEGSGLPRDLQNALAFGSNTSFAAQNSTTTIIAQAGFWRVVATSNIQQSSVNVSNAFTITDGSTTKAIWDHFIHGSTTSNYQGLNVDLVFWLRAGDSLIATSNSATAVLTGSFRQIATGDGTFVQPNGYPL